MKSLLIAIRGSSFMGAIALLLCAGSGNICAQDCGTSPVLRCPSIYIGCSSDDLSPDVLGYPTALPGDTICPIPVITYRDSIVSNNLCGTGKEIRRFWTATYPDDTNPLLIASCSQVIIIKDTEAPVISNCPPDVVVETDASCRAIVRWDQPLASDDCGILGFTSNYGSGSAFFPGITTVTYTATDYCGLMTTCSFTVTVEVACCNDTPVLDIPNDYIGCPGMSIDPSITGQAFGSITGFGCVNAEISYEDVRIDASACPGAEVIQRTWTAVNPNNPNSSSSGIQHITLFDHTTPSIINCPPDITVVASPDCYAVVYWGVPLAFDNCTIQSFTSNYFPGDRFRTGTTTITYTALDRCGNKSICSFDILVIGDCCSGAPDLHVPPDFSDCLQVSTGPAHTGQATATSEVTECPAPLITFSDLLTRDDSCMLSIQRTWKAINPIDTNEITTGVQSIILTDTIAPVIINCPSDITVVSNSDCFAIVDWMIPVTDDNCGTVTLENNLTTGSGSRFELGTTTITYTAEDACGNAAHCSFNVTVLPDCCDDVIFVFCPPDYTGCPGSSTHPNVTGSASSDGTAECPVTITYSDKLISDGPCIGGQIIDRYWIATGAHKLVADTCVQRITLSDVEIPLITLCPPDVERSYINRTYNWADPVVTDNCNTVISYSFPKGVAFPVGMTTVHVTVSDDCGQVAKCQFKVTIQPPDTTSGLVVSCPGDIFIECESALQDPVPVPEVSTDCSICPEGDISGFVFMGSRNGHRYYESQDQLTWMDARAFCEANGGHLAIINDADEHSFLTNKLESNSAFIGLSDYEHEGKFHWVDGSELGYSKWYPQQPNNFKGQQDYVELLRTGYWNDQYNDRESAFIMELPCITIIQTSGPGKLSNITQDTTVIFEISDACGNTQICSTNVFIEKETPMICSEDIEVFSTDEKTVVYFNPPQFLSCCANCTHGREIPGFVFMGTRNGSYYYCSKEKATWHDANARARMNGGYLAIIGNSGENDFLADLLGPTIAFVGISDHAEEGVWRTVNGDLQYYFNWRLDNPNNFEGLQHYVELEPSGKWNDNSGTYKREFIIEVNGCGSVAQTAGIPSGGFFTEGTTQVAFEGKDQCGNLNSCSFHISIIGDPNFTIDYCNSYGISSNNAHIDKVQMNNFTQRTGDNHGYLNFQDTCIHLDIQEPVELTITPGWDVYRYFAYYNIYIDYNDDGDFNDPGELTAKAYSGNTLSEAIEIPAGTKPGKKKLRIIMSLTGYQDPCGSYNYGETEDYCLNITGSNSNQILSKSISKKILNKEVVLSEYVQDKKNTILTVVFPNPATEYITLRSEGNIEALQIIRMDGSIFRKIQNPTGQINVSNLPSGLYLVRMIDNTGTEILEKLIVE